MNHSMFGGNPHDAEQYVVNPHLVTDFVVVFANLFGKDFRLSLIMDGVDKTELRACYLSTFRNPFAEANLSTLRSLGIFTSASR